MTTISCEKESRSSRPRPPKARRTQLTRSKLGSASPSFIHLCLQICSMERRLLGSNTSMWRIRCSHSATDKGAAFSLGDKDTGAAEEFEVRQADALSSPLLLPSLSCSSPLSLFTPRGTRQRQEVAKKSWVNAFITSLTGQIRDTPGVSRIYILSGPI